MTREPEKTVGQPTPPGALHGSDGAIVAGRDVNASVTQYFKQASVLPPEAYAPIPDDAAAGGVSNIGTRLFVGRADELAALEQAFARPGEVVVHAVHGLGGVGKSALATHWAARRHEKLRWRVTANTEAAVDAGMAALAQALQPGLAGLPAKLQSERAVAWLASHTGWLLLLDNVEDPAHIRPLLDRLPGGRVLITTRRATGWHHDATAIRLGVLAPAEAVDLFTRILTHHDPRDTDGADAVCEELGYLALAVELGAAYCAETGMGPRAYLNHLTQRPAATFAAGTAGADSDRTIAGIWRVTLKHLADTPLVGNLLRILAWYAPDDIPRNLLDGLAEPLQLADAIGRLTAYSMIVDNHNGTLTVHRLVQACARTPDPKVPRHTPETIDHARDQAAALLADAFPIDVDLPETWPRCRALLPHTYALTYHHSPDHDTIHTAHVLDRAAAYWKGQGAVATAIPALRRALNARERVLGREHPRTLASCGNLACTFEAAGDLERAIPLHEHALDARERVLGKDHPDTLASRNNLACAYRAAGDLNRAVSLHEQTLADCERVLGTEHSRTLSLLSNLAFAYEAAGDLKRAIPLHKRALDTRERVLGRDHPDTLTSRSNLAGAYRARGDLSRAIPLHERTLTDVERVFGKDHPRTLVSRSNLADAYLAAGDLSRAIPLHERTLEDVERVLGKSHRTTLASRNNLARAYEAAGYLPQAISLHEQNLADCERVLSPDHRDTLVSRSNLASAYWEAGDLSRALPLYERTLADCERILSPNHPDILVSRSNLASLYREMGDLSRAISLQKRTYADSVRTLGEDDPRTLTSLNNLAHVYLEARDLDRAITLHERVLFAREQILGTDHRDTLVSRSNLASAYWEAGDLSRALPLYERTLADCGRVLSPNHPTTALVRANLERARPT
ncbi:tetratricopeptide repeat protein [Streptomyces sp. NPDC020898]|uniref:tetratricopeptide repeat protein n=1 Tax=Streptomyces sp. NPDC020898 TaxID=3365101 RepID=UPI0037903E97